MGQQTRRALALAAAGIMLLLAADQRSEAAGQSRAALSVVVRVVAACGGSTSAPAGAGQCPAGSAPLAVLTETGQGPSAPAASIEEIGDVRYLTLIY